MGSIFTTKSTKCPFKGKIRDEFSDLPTCKICGTNSQPDLVWFGEKEETSRMEGNERRRTTGAISEATYAF